MPHIHELYPNNRPERSRWKLAFEISSEEKYKGWITISLTFIEPSKIYINLSLI